MEQPGKDYIITGGQEGKSRLNVLSGVLQASTRSLLEAHGAHEGMSFLDLGSGGGNVALMAAQMAGSTGHVTAIDFDKEIIALSQQDAAAIGVDNISFIAASAYGLNYTGQFDIACARFLLSHLERPADVLGKMMNSVKPGGKVIVEDVHFSGHYCYPANAAFDRYIAWYIAAAEHQGQDAEIGPAVPGMFRTAGLANIGFDTIQPAFSSGAGKQMGYLTLDRIKQHIVAHGIATQQEVDDTLQQLQSFTNDPASIISLPRIFRVWGTRL